MRAARRARVAAERREPGGGLLRTAPPGPSARLCPLEHALAADKQVALRENAARAHLLAAPLEQNAFRVPELAAHVQEALHDPPPAPLERVDPAAMQRALERHLMRPAPLTELEHTDGAATHAHAGEHAPSEALVVEVVGAHV